MKKLLVFAIVAASFASCTNGEGDKKEVEGVKVDSPMVSQPDTANHPLSDTGKIAQPDTATKK